MHPELVGKKVVTEDGVEIGVIKEIKTDDLGSVLAVIYTRYENYPMLEIPVVSLRKKETAEEIAYVIPTARVPIQLLNEIKSEMETKEIMEKEEAMAVPEVPEVPPLEMFRKEKVEEEKIVHEEEVPQKEEVVKEVPEVKQVEEEKKKGGFLSFIRKIIEAIKKLFKAK